MAAEEAENGWEKVHALLDLTRKDLEGLHRTWQGVVGSCGLAHLNCGISLGWTNATVKETTISALLLLGAYNSSLESKMQLRKN